MTSDTADRVHALASVDTSWPPQRLTLVYDDTCELCRRCQHWLIGQPTHVELRFLASSDPEVYDLYGELPWYKIELMVVTDTGVAWVGPKAFIMCLWATVRWRPASYRLNSRTLAPLAERFFHTVSSNRSVVSGMLAPHRCEPGTCAVPEPANSQTVSTPV